MSFTTETFDALDAQAMSGEAPWSPMTSLGTSVLLDAALGRLDLNMAARAILACRGIGEKGEWEGFPAARQAWRARAHPGYAALARRGGAAVTEKKLASNRANAKMGGRPKKEQPDDEGTSDGTHQGKDHQ